MLWQSYIEYNKGVCMSLFAMGDLHLSFSKEKPMDIFGSTWKNHPEKIKNSWLMQITSEDTVLLPGDISWAMDMEEANADMDFLEQLPGRKILGKGNHDYWWSSVSKVRNRFPALEFLQNDAVLWEDYWICGTRGWVCPNDSRFTEHDRKIYEREQNRLRISLEYGLQKGAEKMIVMLHFPPTNDKKEPSGFTELIEAYPVKKVIYGHLHGIQSFSSGLEGVHNGVLYQLVSSDYLGFCFQKII